MLRQVSTRLSWVLKELAETACKVLANTTKILLRKIEDVQTIYKLLTMTIAFRSILVINFMNPVFSSQPMIDEKYR
jgi:hypothetical protein